MTAAEEGVVAATTSPHSSEDDLSLQSPNIALSTFEAQQKENREKQAAKAAMVLEGREKEAFDMAERAKTIVEKAERRRSEEQDKQRVIEEERRQEQLRQQEANMRRFEEKKRESERLLREQREREALLREQQAFARQETAKLKLQEEETKRKAEEEARLEKEALLQKQQLEKQAAAMARFEEQQALRKMTQEERDAYLAEKALKEQKSGDHNRNKKSSGVGDDWDISDDSGALYTSKDATKASVGRVNRNGFKGRHPGGDGYDEEEKEVDNDDASEKRSIIEQSRAAARQARKLMQKESGPVRSTPTSPVKSPGSAPAPHNGKPSPLLKSKCCVVM